MACVRRVAALGAVLAFLCFLFSPAAGAASAPRSESSATELTGTTDAMKAALATVERHTELGGMVLDDAPGSPALLKGLLHDVRHWVAVRLEANQTPREIVADARRVFHGNSPPGLEPLSALRLDADSVVFSMNEAPVGTVFILHRSRPHVFTTAMDIGNPRTWSGTHAREFAGWRPRNATKGAQAIAGKAYLPPLSPVQLVRLPNEADGAERFAIVAQYAQFAGGTRRFQVSIWRWKRVRATPLMSVNLSQMDELPVIAHVGRTRLVLQEKGRFSQFYACGPCAGRQLALTIELPAHGARLGSVRSLTPQLDLADEFFRRAFHCQPLGRLATRALARRLGRTLARLCRNGGEPVELRRLGLTKLGMLDNVKLHRHGRHETLCLTTDNLHHARLFALAHGPGGRLQITAYQVALPSACGYPNPFQVSWMDGGILKVPRQRGQCRQIRRSSSCARP